jgi:hypothetical protein
MFQLVTAYVAGPFFISIPPASLGVFLESHDFGCCHKRFLLEWLVGDRGRYFALSGVLYSVAEGARYRSEWLVGINVLRARGEHHIRHNFAISGACFSTKGTYRWEKPNSRACMRRIYQFNFIFIFTVALISGCAQLRPGPAVTREQVLATAQDYANHPWRGTAANVFHGLDNAGTWIDTPDVDFWGEGGWYADGRTNIGVPYCWGGASSLAEFDQGLLKGRPAGYHFRGPRVNHPDSVLPVGVDCSGLVSRCWRLRARRSTYDIGEICEPLPNYDDLLPGDAVNKPYDHVILFVGWVDGTHEKMQVLEAGDAKRGGDPKNYQRVHEDVYDREWLLKHGFVALRYKQIR